MKNASETYGVAELGGKILAARVENDGVRRKVTSLQTADEKFDNESLASGRLFFGVDARLAVVKKIKVSKPSEIEADEIARFEMAQSLLEEPGAYYFDNLPLAGDNGTQKFMSIAYHRQEIDRLIEDYRKKLRQPSGFKLNAIALARGYETFCRLDPGELQVLADIETDFIILVILHRGRLYGIGRLETAPGETISPAVASKLAAEFKLTLSYHLAELFQDGITVPVSRIVLSGALARDELLTAALKDRFPAEITLPHFHQGYFQPSDETTEDLHPEEFLIPLGLAVE